ncbi:MAG: HNH endonuclease domain-containing protein [Chitinophagaceae bacterium]
MSKVLGLDLGTNSIGWAIVDDSLKQIIDCGVRIFPEGVNRDTKGAEVSKNETRRTKRQTRRQYFRRKVRTAKLVEVLISKEMFPDIEKIFESYSEKSKPATNNFITKLFFCLNQVQLHDDLRDYFQKNPYTLRKLALNGDRLSLMDLGRVLYQLSQRRGYKENLQSPLADGKTLIKGDAEKGTLGIEATKSLIEKHGSLGAGMAALLNRHSDYIKSNNNIQQLPERIRNRYTLRSMYTDEFENIWKHQSKNYPDILTNEFKEILGHETKGILFYQRELRNQQFLIGKCTFETGKPRARLSSPWFEQYRMYQFINSIRIDGNSLNEEQRFAIIEIFNSTTDKITFSDIKKKIKKADGNFNYEDKLKIPGNKTISGLRKVFGKSFWDKMTQGEQEQAWLIKMNAIDPGKTKLYLKTKWRFNEKQVEDFFKLRLADDYASLSTTAIKKILPYLEKGKLYNEAVIMAGVQNAFGHTNWKKLNDEERKTLEDTIEGEINHIEGEKILDRVKKILSKSYGLPESRLKKLYHHSEVTEITFIGKFPESDKEIQKVRNPVVIACLFEIRKLVKDIIKQYGTIDEIKIELARELKSSKKDRESYRFRQYDNEAANDDAKKILDEYNKPHTRANIRKVLLFKEIEKVYGSAVNPFNPSQTFRITDLFREGYVQIEHIIPYSVSLDDSIGNLTLCDADTNRDKGDRTPFQYFKEKGNNWEIIKQQIFKILPYKKACRFISETNPALDDFIQRQLNDTRYISKFAKEYLKYICQKVNVSSGGTTSNLRHLWGLDSILSLKPFDVPNYEQGEYCVAIDENEEPIEGAFRKWEWSEGNKSNKKNEEELKKLGRIIWGVVRKGKFYPKKTRDDHRHHAIDAITIACTKTYFVSEISRVNSRFTNFEEYIHQAADFPDPWPSFFQDTDKAVKKILVSYKKQNKVLSKTRKALFDKKTGKPLFKNGNRLYGQGIAARGELHEATYYGKRRSPGQEHYSYHIRKKLQDLTPAMIGKIVDSNVRAAIIASIRKIKPDINFTDKKLEIPSGAFFDKTESGQLIPKVFLPNKNGNPVPVYKVRIRNSSSNAVNLKDYNVWVEPGSNHHIVLFDTPVGRKGTVIPFWDAAERKKNNLPLLDNNVEGAFVMSLQKGDMVLLDVDESLTNSELHEIPNLHSKLYYIRKFSSGSGGISMVFTLSTSSNINPDKDKKPFVERRSPSTFKGIKVIINNLGKLSKS